VTRGAVLLAGLAVFVLGGAGYLAFQWGGFEGFSPGIAASALLMLVVLVWTGSYLLRVVGGRMTYMEQRRRYRTAYDALTDADLQARFEALSPDEQRRLLIELGQLDPSEAAGQSSAARETSGADQIPSATEPRAAGDSSRSTAERRSAPAGDAGPPITAASGSGREDGTPTP